MMQLFGEKNKSKLPELGTRMQLYDASLTRLEVLTPTLDVRSVHLKRLRLFPQLR